MWVFQKHAGGDAEQLIMCLIVYVNCVVLMCTTFMLCMVNAQTQLLFGPQNITGMLGCYSAECTRLSIL